MIRHPRRNHRCIYMYFFSSKSGKKKPPLERTISTLDKGDKAEWKEDKTKKPVDKLIEAEKSETGNVSKKNINI